MSNEPNQQLASSEPQGWCPWENGKVVKKIIKPIGRRKSAFQAHADRAAYYSTEFTVAELREMVNDPVKYDKLSSFDAVIVRNLVYQHMPRAMDDKLEVHQFAATERERFMDRYLIPPKQKDDSAALAGAMMGAATLAIVNKLSEKILGVGIHMPESEIGETIEQGVDTSS